MFTISSVWATSGGAIAALLCWASTTTAQPAVSDAKGSDGEVIIGVALGVLGHEMAHALISELDVPATGPQEDAADGFAALSLAQGADGPFFERIVRYSSLYWFYRSEPTNLQGRNFSVLTEDDWFSEHAPAMRRFHNALCLVYGSNPESFTFLVSRYRVDVQYKKRCIREYFRRLRAWEAIVRPFRRDLGPQYPRGDRPPDEPGGEVRLAFRQSVTRFGNVVRGVLQEFLESWAADIQKSIVWPRDITVEFRDCVGSGYSPWANVVTICFAQIEDFSRRVIKGEGIEPTLTALRSSEEGVRFLQDSTWRAALFSNSNSNDNSVEFVERVFARDRQYREVNSGIGSSTVGRWWVEKAGSRMYSVYLEPEEFCDSSGKCAPVEAGRQFPYSLQYAVRGVDEMELLYDGSVWKRIQDTHAEKLQHTEPE